VFPKLRNTLEGTRYDVKTSGQIIIEQLLSLYRQRGASSIGRKVCTWWRDLKGINLPSLCTEYLHFHSFSLSTCWRGLKFCNCITTISPSYQFTQTPKEISVLFCSEIFSQRKHDSPKEWLYVKFGHKDEIYWLTGEFHLYRNGAERSVTELPIHCSSTPYFFEHFIKLPLLRKNGSR
jgi:hypothetical protein